MLRIVNPSPANEAAVSRFLRGHLKETGRLLAHAYVRERPKEVFLATEAGSILGFSNLQRVTSGTAAIANLRIGKRQGMLTAAAMLVEATVKRARELLQKSITCVESRSGQPSVSILKSQGFEFWFTREMFSGSTAENQDVAISTVRSELQAASVMVRLGPGGAVHRDFRPVAASIESLADLLTNGVLLGDKADSGDLVAVRASKAIIDKEGEAYFVPSYLSDASLCLAEAVGEVSIMGESASPGTISAASDWLKRKGVKVMYVYCKQNLPLGKQLSERGLTFVGAQNVWRKDLRGPFDQFLSQNTLT